MLGERIHTARRAKKLKQEDVAKALGVTKNAVSMWEKGKRNPKGEQLEKLFKLLGIDPKQEGVEMIREDVVRIPIRGKVWATPFRLASASRAIKSVIARPGEAGYFALEVEGDSMKPAYNHGDIIICQPRDEVLSPFIGDDEGSYVPREKYQYLHNRDCVVTLNGETCLKRIEIRARKGLEWEMRLVSLNPDYPPVPVKYGDEFRCEGIVVRNELPPLPDLA